MTSGFLRMHSPVGVFALLITIGIMGRPCIAAVNGAAAQYERPEAQMIKDCTRSILADPQFAPHKTFAQWLQEKLRRWDRPDIDLPRGVGAFLMWAITAWCVLTLLAILIHFGWTVWVLVRRPQEPGVAAGSDGSTCYEHLSFEQLWHKARELAQRGAFREAAGVLLIALLRRLEAVDVLRFHASKTNGEYLREYPGQSPGRPQFAQFIAMFERSIYGGLEIPGQTYEEMNSLAQRILSDVGPEP